METRPSAAPAAWLCLGFRPSESSRKPALLLPALPCPGLVPVAKSSLILGVGGQAFSVLLFPLFGTLLFSPPPPSLPEQALPRAHSVPFRPTNDPSWGVSEPISCCFSGGI